MSKPYRITCHSVAEIPSIDKLQQLVTLNQHIVLQFPLPIVGNFFDKRAIIEQLSPKLLNYSVFDSGYRNDETYITIIQVINKESILCNAEMFMEAIDRFLNLADKLLLNLAQNLKFEVHDLERYIYSEDFITSRIASTGMLDNNWDYFFHGSECRFQNKTTGQIVDITLRRVSNRYARVNPYFFGEYVHTTDQEEAIASFIKHKFHDSLRILEILEENNHLVR